MTCESAPTLQGLREASERWAQRERTRPRLTCGVAALDTLLGGGWPQGKVGELAGPASSGRSGVAVATVAAATARGEVVAWLDLPDAFNPASAAAAGADLARVLWVRPRGLEEAVRTAELVLEVGGFTVAVLDLGSAAITARAIPGSTRGRGRGALRLRLARAVERAGVVALVLTERPWVGTLAGATVVLERGEARWGACGESRWLDGIVPQVRLERGRVGGAASNREADAVAQTVPSATPVILRSGADGAATKDPTDVIPPTGSLALPWDPSRAARAQDDGGVGPSSGAALGA